MKDQGNFQFWERGFSLTADFAKNFSTSFYSSEFSQVHVSSKGIYRTLTFLRNFGSSLIIDKIILSKLSFGKKLLFLELKTLKE